MQLSAEITAGRWVTRSDIPGLVSARMKFGLSLEMGIWGEKANASDSSSRNALELQNIRADERFQRPKEPRLLVAEMTKLKLRELG